MNSQFYFANAGWILSPIITCFVVITLMYNMLLLTQIADALQYKGILFIFNYLDPKRNTFGQINSYEKTISLIIQKPFTKKIIFYIVQFFVSSFNYCTILINGTNFARFLHNFFKSDIPDENFTNSLYFYKLLTILLMLLLMLIIKSSAYLKVPSLISTAIIIISLLIFWSKNCFEIGLTNLSNMKSFNWSQGLPLISSQVYSIESIGTCLLYTSPSPRDLSTSRMPSSA